MQKYIFNNCRSRSSRCRSAYRDWCCARTARTWRVQGFHERCANQSNKCKSVFMRGLIYTPLIHYAFQSQSNSTRDYVRILLASLNQFKLIDHVVGTTAPLRLPTVLAQGSLGCREGSFTRETVGDIRRSTRNRRTSHLIRRSYVKEK